MYFCKVLMAANTVYIVTITIYKYIFQVCDRKRCNNIKNANLTHDYKIYIVCFVLKMLVRID